MPPSIARIVFLIGVTGFFLLDRDRKAKTSRALWIPVIWLLINGSRPVSLWLDSHTGEALTSSAQYLDGNPLDAGVYAALLAVGIVVLALRKSRVIGILRNNSAILMFFAYCAFSALWSDYPETSLKRWTKALGDLVMVLIVISDREPVTAVKRLVARVGFVLVPASVLLIKYYPALGRVYNIWTWEPMFVGVTEHKNTLGLVCMALGLGLLWRFLLAYRDREDVRRKKRLMVYGVVIAMLIWLFVQANSVTAQSCLILGSAFLFLSVTRFIRKERWRSYLLVAALVMAPFATLFLGVGGSALQGMGRDATLTGRTEIWKDVLSMSGNPLTGVGFESFWLGQRADRMWRMFYFHPTQAHNGYIEIYLELGWIGIALLAAVAIAGCRNAVATLRWDPMTARMRLAYIVIGLAYNMTEAGFRMMTLTWFFFLLSVVVVPKVTKEKKVPTILEPSATAAPGWEWNELQPQDTAPGLIGRSLEAF